jgi:hypothetical protein
MKKSKLGFLMKIVRKLQILIKFDRDNFILRKINVFFRKKYKIEFCGILSCFSRHLKFLVGVLESPKLIGFA